MRRSNPSRLTAIRNPEGTFINTQCFREEGKHFLKYGYYTPDPWGTPAWKDYWGEQINRCINGYSSGGVKITGEHYGYLNFALIKQANLTDGKIEAGGKITKFPDFWDGDYNYFWAGLIAERGMTRMEIDNLGLSIKIRDEYIDGFRHMIVGKARRKGYSYKNAWKVVNKYNTVRDSVSIIGAFDKKYLYPEGTMGMANNYINFLNEHTGFAKSRDFIDQVQHKKASFAKIINGNPVESGYKSQIMAITFKDNPDAARGKDPMLILFEEAGKFPNLIDSVNATLPGLTAGRFITGQMYIFGTSGDMEKGTKDFAKIFYSPDNYRIMPFVNIWDEDAEAGNCGFFHGAEWNMEGFYDEDGNSDTEGALKWIKDKRDRLVANNAGSLAIQSDMQEFPQSPREAFLLVSRNNMPVVELQNRYDKVMREKLHLKFGTPVTLYRDENGEVQAKIDLKGELNPIWGNEPEGTDRAGCVVIYEFPTKKPPRGLYKIGYDPYDQDNGDSFGSITVKKGIEKGKWSRNNLAAEYFGRPDNVDDMNLQFELICEYFNMPGMYENGSIHVKTYMQRRKKLQWLATQPDLVIAKSVKESNVERVYGCHMTDQLKDAGEKYIKNWLLTEMEVDEDGKKLIVIDYINSPGLLEQLISYSRKGNWDRVMSLMQVMFQEEEEELGKEHDELPPEEAVNELMNLFNNQFKKRV